MVFLTSFSTVEAWKYFKMPKTGSQGLGGNSQRNVFFPTLLCIAMTLPISGDQWFWENAILETSFLLWSHWSLKKAYKRQKQVARTLVETAKGMCFSLFSVLFWQYQLWGTMVLGASMLNHLFYYENVNLQKKPLKCRKQVAVTLVENLKRKYFFLLHSVVPGH